MSTARIVRRVKLGVGHLRTGNTRHYAKGALLGAPAQLMVVQFGDAAYNLIHLDDDGKEMTDTFHETIPEAFKQAEFEFRIRPEEWTFTDEPYD